MLGQQISSFTIRSAKRSPDRAGTDREVTVPSSFRAGKSPTLEEDNVIDPKAIENLLMLQDETDPNFLSQVFDSYLIYSCRLMETLSHAVKHRDYEAASEISHSLKSCSANVGAMRLAVLCRQMEDAACNGGKNETIGDLLSRMEAEYGKAQRAILRILTFGVQ